MRDRPDGAALLKQARAALLDDLLPELPEARRYEALMVASAMAIAMRELEAVEARDAERLALETLVGAADGEDLGAVLLALHGRLKAAIRDGGMDGDRRLHDLLRRDTTDRLALSNPKILAAAADS